MGNNYENFSRNPQAREVKGITILPKYRKESENQKLNTRRKVIGCFLTVGAITAVAALGYWINSITSFQEKDSFEITSPITLDSNLNDVNNNSSILCPTNRGDLVTIIGTSSYGYPQSESKPVYRVIDNNTGCKGWIFKPDLKKQKEIKDKKLRSDLITLNQDYFDNKK